MKKEMNPAVVIAVIAVFVVVVGFLIWRGVSGGAGSIPPGGKGNASPFAPGGQANSAQKAHPPMGKR